MLIINLLQISILSSITVLQVQSSCTSVRSECKENQKSCGRNLKKFKKCEVKKINVLN